VAFDAQRNLAIVTSALSWCRGRASALVVVDVAMAHEPRVISVLSSKPLL
jgi:hypothetical protein